MCVIAIKPSNIDLPQEEKLKLMWDKNPDGAGYMYTFDNKVIITKGYMTFSDLKASLNELKTQLATKNKTIKDIPMVLHFRITTHGGTSPQNTHPFPITNKEEYLTALDVSCNVAMAHNGVISGLPNEETMSDTQIYIRDILYDLSMVDNGFIKRFSKVIELSKGASRFAFLDKEGTITTFGNFKKLTEDDGLSYSNTLFEPTKTPYQYPNYSHYSYGGYKDTIVPEVDKSYEIDKTKASVYYKKYYDKKLIWDNTGVSKNYFIVVETGESFWVPLVYVKEIESCEVLVKDDEHYNKNNIGGKKNSETKYILQNANRTLYDKLEYKSLMFTKIDENSLLASKDIIDSMKFGDFLTDEFEIYVETDNWYYNEADKHFYYKQKDSSLIRIEKKYLFGELVIDDADYVYVGYSEAPLSKEEIILENVIVYIAKDGVEV